LAKILQDEGLITSFELVKDTKFPTLRVQLKYFQDKKHAIRIIRRISKPGLRVYSSSEKLRPVRNGLATQVVSTSQGIMTDRDARRRHIGGEVMFEVW
jgi:small subunit ribosomal protein S8